MTDAETAQPQVGRAIVVDTPVAKPVAARDVITRRVLLLGGLWSTLGLVLVGLLTGPLDFMWPRNLGGFGGPITVPPDLIPEPGGDPIRNIEGRFWLVNLEAGTTSTGVESPGGALALYQKCPHLGCTVPWNPGFTFAGVRGWFRCPCHGSTYTKDGGVRVAGPAPRPMDVFPLTVIDDGSVTVQTGRAFEGTGSTENPTRAVPLEPGNTTPDL
jgi:cytochrome b6-f complex iron-sulfur subunit